MVFSLTKKHLLESLFSHKSLKYGVNYILSSDYALKSNLPIKWVRPEKIPCFKPEKSGDLEPLMKIDPTTLAPEFRDIEELKSADENVKKLFTLEFQPYKKTVRTLREEYMKKVRRHTLDENSYESRLARMTSDIRDMQIYMESHPKDARTKVRLKETIDKRKHLLKNLRSWDYKCFEYVIEKLNLVYKPFPGPEVWKRIERKRSLRMLTEKHCDEMVQSKLTEYRQYLESQQEDFLAEKVKTLRWIREQEEYCGVPCTVSLEDISDAETKLEQLRKAKRTSQTEVID